MRVFSYVVVCLIGATAALAQPASKPSTTRDPSETELLLDAEARAKECMKTWDATTHMSKLEWERTCRRVSEERIEYLRKQGYGVERK